MLVPAQVVDQVCQGVVGRVPRKTDHSAGHSVKVLLQESVEFIEQLFKKPFFVNFSLKAHIVFSSDRHLVAVVEAGEDDDFGVHHRSREVWT